MNPMGPVAGMWMLLLLGGLTISTGLPVWALLIGVSSVFAVAGVFSGVMDVHILAAMPVRLVGLLENDLLQALPLYVFVGMLLQRLAVADALFAVMSRLFRPLGAGNALASLGVGALIAPMNGSVASSSALLSRLVAPRLEKLDAAKATALVSVAATIGVVVPPSLVLILLGDAMLRAHTEASNLPGFVLGTHRIINTQDVFNAALLPGVAILLLWAVVARWKCRDFEPPATHARAGQYVVAAITTGTIVLLLGGVFTGKLFAVEAAATGGMLLLLAAVAARALDWAQWKTLLGETLELSGALFALLVGATVFSLIFRLFGTDRWLSEQLLASPLPPLLTAAVVLVTVALCAWVLDAFEMIFVVIPIVTPPLIAMLGDAQQAAVLLLLVLQLSFLIPPMGYAVMMARSTLGQGLSTARILVALAPFVLVQLGMVGAVFVWPEMVHGLDAQEVLVAPDADQDIARQMQEMSALPTPDGSADALQTDGTKQ
jgi:TRAP-type mannitol/chloroaromatic compound transport system permease large subunit